MIVFQVPAIVGGTVLIIERMESQNYVPGVSGWGIFANGNAEFNDVTIRGTLETGVPPDPRIKIPDGMAVIEFYSGEPTEVAPGAIEVYQLAPDHAALEMRGIELPGLPPPNVIMSSSNATVPPETTIDSFADRHTFGDIGSSDVVQMFDGYVVADNMAPVTAIDNNNDVSAQTNSTAYVALVGSTGPQPNPFNTIPRPRSGRLLVHISCDMSPSNAAGIALTSFQLRNLNGVGAVITPVTDSQAILYQTDAANGRANFGRTFYIDGIDTSVCPSGVVFFQMLHRVVAAATVGTFRRRYITVQPLP